MFRTFMINVSNSARVFLRLYRVHPVPTSPSQTQTMQAVDVLLLFLSLGLGFVCVLLALQMSRPTFFHLGLANCCSFLVLFMTVKSCVSREFKR